MNFDDMGFAFPQECLRAALLISLLSVWALVGLFYYLNRYTRREYFSIWTGAWLCYAVWLTLSLGLGEAAAGMAERLFGEWPAYQIELMRSQLLPQGARHSTVAAVALPDLPAELA